MTNEEKERAIQAMNNALAPRNKDGLIIPVTFMDDPEEMYFPVIEPDEKGLVRPMTFAEDFQDGKTPPDMKYAPGHQRFYVPVDHPRYLESICYDDPLQNLPIQEQNLLQRARQLGIVPGMRIEQRDNVIILAPPQTQMSEEKLADVIAGASAEKSNDLKIMSSVEDTISIDHEVIRVHDELHVKTDKGAVQLASFSLEAVEHRLVHESYKSDDVLDEYEISVKTKGKETRIVIAAKDLNNIVEKIQRQLPMTTVSVGIPKANAMIVNYVRKQLDALPERHHVRVSGFVKLKGRWVFAHDGAEFPGDHVVFRTGRTIPVDRNLIARGAFHNAMEFLKISDKQALILPMFLVAHLSPLFNLFEEAGHIPRFVTFICGRTGSLKTSTALVAFRLFEEQPASPEANFRDSETALEIKLGESNGRVLLVDDYRPPVTAVDGKSNLAKLESVVRAAGDRIAKSRSNSELGKAREFLPSGCVVVTGEDLGGTQSSQLRMLILPILKDDIDGKKLKRFQDDPQLITTHMHHFLKWAGENGDAIIEAIRTNFEHERNYFSQQLKEARVVDTAVTLMLTAKLILAYGQGLNGLAKGTEMQVHHEWRQAILQAVMASEGTSKTQDPVSMYLQAFFDMLDRREISVSSDIKCYEAGRDIGYASGDNFWLWHKQLYSHVSRYWQKLGVLFPLTPEKVNEHLEAAGIIQACYEGSKKLYVRKSGLPKRSRLMVLNEPAARKYLDNEFK